jgi:hypothetical protein
VAVRQKGVRLVDRAGRVRLRLIGPWEQNPLEDIRDACRVDSGVEKLLYQSVQDARAAGHSWADIGRAMGTTRQAAWERFCDPMGGRGWSAAVDEGPLPL